MEIASPPEVRTELITVIRSVLPDLEAVDESKHLGEMGADSVDRVEILVEVQRRLGLNAPLSRFAEVPDLATLIELLADLIRGRS